MDVVAGSMAMGTRLPVVTIAVEVCSVSVVVVVVESPAVASEAW